MPIKIIHKVELEDEKVSKDKYHIEQISDIGSYVDALYLSIEEIKQLK